MRQTAKFFLLVSSFMVMVQGFKSEQPSQLREGRLVMAQGFQSEQPSQLREGRLVRGRTTNCDFCIGDKVRKDLYMRDATYERSQLERGQTNKEVLRDMTINPERRLYSFRDEARTRIHRDREDLRRDEDRDFRLFRRRERESDRYRRYDNAYDRRREERVVELKNERERKRKIELRSESRRDGSRVWRTRDRNEDVRNIRAQENREIRSPRRNENNLDETRDATGVAQRDTKEIRIDGRRLDREQPVRASKLRNLERKQERMSNDRGEDEDKRQKRVGERNERDRSTERRHITISRLQEISGRRKEIVPFDNRVADHSEVKEVSRPQGTGTNREVSINQIRSPLKIEQRVLRRLSDNAVRDEQMSMVQGREISERGEPSASIDDNRFSSKLDNSRRISRVSSSGFSDMRRVVSSSQRAQHRRLRTDSRLLSSRRDGTRRTRDKLSDTRRVESLPQSDHYQKENPEDNRDERRQQRIGSSRSRGEQLRDYRSDDKIMDRRRAVSSIDKVRDQNRGKVSHIGKRLGTVRHFITNVSNSLSDSNNLNAPRNREYRQVIAFLENEPSRRRKAEENLDVDINGKRREYQLNPRSILVQPDSRSRDVREYRRTRLDSKYIPNGLSTDPNLQISSLALKTRCLNRHRIDRDDRRRNGNVAFTDGRMGGLQRSVDQRRRNIAERDAGFREPSLKHQIPDPSMKVENPLAPWSTKFISVDGWSVTRAIFVGFVGIMGRSLWQKQI